MKLWALTTVWCSVTARAFSASSNTMPPLAEQRSKFDSPLIGKVMSYLDSSPDPFHCVQTSTQILEQAGFVKCDSNTIPEKGGKYYFSKNKSALVAFAVGKEYYPGEGGFKIIGGHSDSPNLKIKPNSKRSPNSANAIQLAVECYGGGLWHTWFDRDLGLSGRVFVRTNNSSNNSIQQKLVKIDRAILRIPNLAIHLQTASEREAFAVNKEDHLQPILAMQVQKALGTKKDSDEGMDGWDSYQEPLLLQILAEELQVQVDQIIDFELNLFDIQKASIGGAFGEFLHSARLDNLASCFMAVQALSEHPLDEDKDISMIVLFDHEEVGSSSATGAGSPIMADAIRRISSVLLKDDKQNAEQMYANTIDRSFVLSVDQAHAVHPNYASKHEKGHSPKMNSGMVIKRNSNQRYATNAVTGLIMKEIARKANLPILQEFVVRNDCGCGSTIGPIISTATGIRAIDMGCPQLSMHSIRETMGVTDIVHGVNLFKAFYTHFREIDSIVEG